MLARRKTKAHVVLSESSLVDVIPAPAGKGPAVAYVSRRWKLPLAKIITAGNSGNDADMLTGGALGIVVGNHARNLANLKASPRLYFAQGSYSEGVLEGIRYYQSRNKKRIS